MPLERLVADQEVDGLGGAGSVAVRVGSQRADQSMAYPGLAKQPRDLEYRPRIMRAGRRAFFSSGWLPGFIRRLLPMAICALIVEGCPKSLARLLVQVLDRSSRRGSCSPRGHFDMSEETGSP
jgi:hypothetical protein